MVMKKVITGLLVCMIVIGCVVASVACVPSEELAVGKELMKYGSQLDALTQLQTGSVDVAIIDSVMAGYYTSQGDFAKDLQMVDGVVFAEEEYGIAGRKEDKAFMSEINKALIALRTTEYASIAEDFGLTTELAITAETKNPLESATDDSWTKIKEAGKIIIGYTVFAPIAFTQNGALTGFDIELARAVVAYLNDTYGINLTLEFQEIDWSSKEILLSNGSVDLLWNGFTITEERAANMCMSVAYLYNKQVAVIRKADADKYTSEESMAEAIIGVESGSAGEDVALGK